MSSPSVTTTTCPTCSAATSGRFCSSCGTPLDGAACAGCRASLTPGAKFCHRCGTAAGAAGASTVPAEPRGGIAALPWAVASIALLALIALIAGQRFNAPSGGGLDAPRNALPQAGLDFPAAGGPFAGGPGQGAPARAPDISQMSPEERASRLFDRVMALSEQGKRDSVMFFSPMALTSYQMLGDLNLDQRYDLGRIGQVSGAAALARAQADTILRENPTHLLGLTLAAQAAEERGDDAARREYAQRLLAAQSSELAKNLPEYQAHRVDIDSAVARARRGARAQ